jgi:hypothetical protein
LVRIDAVTEGAVNDDAKRARYAQQLRQLTGEEISRAYITEAKRQATIKINLPESEIVGAAPRNGTVQP